MHVGAAGGTMSFTVGLLELLGYLVPGATVVGVAVLVLSGLTGGSAGGGDPTSQLIIYGIASYVTGHALTVMSRSLTWLRIKTMGHRARRYAFFPRLKHLLEERFGGSVGPAEEYHLCRVLVIETCPRSNERIERYFALTLLARNLTVAFVLLLLFVAWAGYYAWAGVFAAGAGLFAYQHFQFEGTLERAVFRTAFVALTAPGLVNRPSGESSSSSA
jgi:hypothetical protein